MHINTYTDVKCMGLDFDVYEVFSSAWYTEGIF